MRKGRMNPAEWVLIADARAIKHINPRDLHFDLLSGQIESAYRHIAPDGTETWGPLAPSDWQEVNDKGDFDGLPHAFLRKGIPSGEGRWFFFVRRANLDQRYSPPPAAAATIHRIDDMRPPPRRPGPPPDTQRWFGICAEIARRCIDPKTGRVKVPQSENKLAEEVLTWLEENEQGQPSTSEMREAVKRVCAMLRTVQR